GRVGVGGAGQARARAGDDATGLRGAWGGCGDVAGAVRDRVGERVAGALCAYAALVRAREGLVGAGGAGVGGGRLRDLEVGGAVDGRRRGGAVVGGGRVARVVGGDRGRVRERAAVGVAGADVDDDRPADAGAGGQARLRAGEGAGSLGAGRAARRDEAGAGRDGVGQREAGVVGGAEVVDLDREG